MADTTVWALGALAGLGALIWLWWHRRARARSYIVIDGSNVLYWLNDSPALAPVIEVVRQIERAGATPVVWFDANVGYLIEGRYHAGRLELDIAPRPARAAA